RISPRLLALRFRLRARRRRNLRTGTKNSVQRRRTADAYAACQRPQTIPSPSVVHFRGGRNAIDKTSYPSLDGFFADLGEAYHAAVGSFASAGCRYLQIDEVNIAYLCDPEQIAALKARGEHVENLLQIYGAMLNRAIEARPPGMTISMHL